MIGKINVKVSSENARFPLGTLILECGHDATIGVDDVPECRNGVKIDEVRVALTNAAGVNTSYVAKKLRPSSWSFTVPAGDLQHAGFARAGLAVVASGRDAQGAVCNWQLGIGDVEYVSHDPAVANLGTMTLIHLRGEKPSTPVYGDAYESGGQIYWFNGEGWHPFGAKGEPGDASNFFSGREFNIDTADGQYMAIKAIVESMGGKVKTAVMMAALALSSLALAAPPSGYTNDTYTADGVTWTRHGALNVRGDYVVTDTTAGGGNVGGMVTTNEISEYREKVDLNVYEGRLVSPRQLDELCLPITFMFDNQLCTDCRINVLDDFGEGVFLGFSAEAQNGFGGETVKVWFDDNGFARRVESSYNQSYLFGGKPFIAGKWPRLKMDIVATGDKLATTGDVAVVDAKVEESLAYSKGVFTYMTGNTNAWFSGTNYPDKATAPNKFKFQFEPGMDLLSVPCSMALNEIREGEKQVVWDQRDWTAWYWSFKASQMKAEIAATNAAIYAEIDRLRSTVPSKAWSSYTARGLKNPDPLTTWVDTENVTLSAGMAWQTVANVSGCAYWTIVGNGAVLGASGTNAVFEIKDFDGRSVMRIVKGENYLAYVDSSSMTGQGTDAQGRVTFDMMANVQPVGEYSTILETSSFVAESDAACPVDYEWENLGDGKWRIHFLLKPGISADACFARFKVAVQRDSTIEYTTAPTISGGLIYNGVKIAPVIDGDTVTWKVVK